VNPLTRALLAVAVALLEGASQGRYPVPRLLYRVAVCCVLDEFDRGPALSRSDGREHWGVFRGSCGVRKRAQSVRPVSEFLR
jgi:hypothetical protein